MLVLFHITGWEQTAKRNTNPASFGHGRKGRRGSGRLTWGGGGSGLTLNSPPVIVRSLMTRQKWSRNRAAQRSVGLGGQLSDEDKMVVGWEGGPSVPLLDPAYRGSGALTSVITHGCVIVLCCCPRR